MCCFKNKEDDFIFINFHVHLQVYKLHAFLITAINRQTAMFVADSPR